LRLLESETINSALLNLRTRIIRGGEGLEQVGAPDGAGDCDVWGAYIG
jgi:hypothetical protein